MRQVWVEGYLWSFPYYLIGAAIAGFVSYLTGRSDGRRRCSRWPVVYVIYRSYRLYVGKLEDGKNSCGRNVAPAPAHD